MKFALIMGSIFFSITTFAGLPMTTRTESGVSVTVEGKQVTHIAQPIPMDGGHGRKAILKTDLELDRDCDSVGLMVEQFTDGDAIVAYCKVDSGPTGVFMANLMPPTCREGALTRSARSLYVCRLSLPTCTYEYNPYTWEQLSADSTDNNHPCME